MPSDLPDRFHQGEELTVEVVDAMLRELNRWRKIQAAPPLAIANAAGGSPPLLWMINDPLLVPFQAKTAVNAGTLSSPTQFTATILSPIPGSTGPNGPTLNSSTTSAPIASDTDLGRHFLNVAIKAGANGWAIWWAGYLWPICWDNC